MQKPLLEIATFSLQGAIDAAMVGAHRIELCENPKDGGTTPSYGMMKIASKNISIPIFPIIRPRGGNFVYSPEEIDIIIHDIEMVKKLGIKGIVVGALTKNGDVDMNNMKYIMNHAHGLEVTFHRAFDRVRHLEESLENIISLGCKRILTSGQFPTAMEGIYNLKKIINLANKRIIIMPGSGVNSSNIHELATLTQATEYHTAARLSIHEPNVYNNKTMNETPNYTGVDTNEIKNILKELRTLT